MASARELLEQADALMRRNRDRVVDTEVPELTEVVAEVAPGPVATLIELADVPELVDVIEEIEIASIVELPEGIDEVSGRLPHDPGGLSDGGREPDSATTVDAVVDAPGSESGPDRSLLSIVDNPGFATDGMPTVEQESPAIESLAPTVDAASPAPESAPDLAESAAYVAESTAPAAEAVPPAAESAPPVADSAPHLAESARPAVESAPPVVESAPPAVESAPPVVETAPPVVETAPPVVEAAPLVAEAAPLVAEAAPLVAETAPLLAEAAPLLAESAPPAAEIAPKTTESTPPEPAIGADAPPALPPPIADDWARWEALAEEIRMQVLQRIDIFTDTRLRKQLSAQLQPIVDRAAVQMVGTINEEVGRLLRAYIAEAIEREIDKWRGTGD